MPRQRARRGGERREDLFRMIEAFQRLRELTVEARQGRVPAPERREQTGAPVEIEAPGQNADLIPVSVVR